MNRRHSGSNPVPRISQANAEPLELGTYARVCTIGISTLDGWALDGVQGDDHSDDILVSQSQSIDWTQHTICIL